jgi:hypothetical protein
LYTWSSRRNIEVVGGLVEQQQVRLLYQRFRERDAPSPAARQFIHFLVGGQVQLGNGGFDALLEVPTVMCINLGVQRLEFTQSMFVEFELRLVRILFEQRFNLGQP